jgi:hypothetical protein
MKLQQYLDDLSPEEHDADEIETLALKITNGVICAPREHNNAQRHQEKQHSYVSDEPKIADVGPRALQPDSATLDIGTPDLSKVQKIHASAPLDHAWSSASLPKVSFNWSGTRVTEQEALLNEGNVPDSINRCSFLRLCRQVVDVITSQNKSEESSRPWWP